MAPNIGFARTPDGVRIAYSVHGHGQPLVFVRGWVTHLELLWTDDAFRTFFEALGRRNRVVRFDARGNGLSDRDVAPPELDDLVCDLETVMDTLGIETAAVWGSSYGGPIAVRYAAAHRDRVERLILDGTFAVGRDSATPQHAGVGRMIDALPSAPEAVFAGISYLTDPEPSARHETRVDRMIRSIDPPFAARLYALLPRIDVSGQAAELRVPTLVMHRRDSRAVNLDAGRRLAALIPGSEFVGLEGGAHNPWEGDWRSVLRRMASFLHAEDEVELPASRKPATPGLVIVLFTDIVGSTDLTTRHGDAAGQKVLRRHNEVVRSALESFSGNEIKHTGDGILATFDSVSSALDCALEIRRCVDDPEAGHAGLPVLLRIGLNAGEPIVEEGDVYGSSVQLAARICAHAEPGQVLVSNVVRDLAAGKEFSFDDRGEAVLRGFDAPVRVHALST